MASSKPAQEPKEFYISPTNGQCIFFAGNYPISGTVELDVVDPIPAESVVVRFIGACSTHWVRYVSRGRDSNYHKHYSSQDRDGNKGIVDIEIPVWKPTEGGEGGSVIPAGHHSFPFSFTLPGDREYPPSIKQDKMGQIKYVICADIDCGSSYHHRCFLPITLLPVVNCDDDQFKKETGGHMKKNCKHLLIPGGMVKMDVRVPSSAWCPGEEIPVHIHIENHSRYVVDNISIEVYQNTKYTCEEQVYESNVGYGTLVHKILNRRVETEQDFDMISFIRVPSCPPSFSLESAGFMYNDYSLEINLTIPHQHGGTSVKFPIVIGTIPHQRLPLFAEQAETADVPVFSWATADEIAKNAAAGQHATPLKPVPFDRKYSGTEEPDFLDIPYEIKYAFFMMPEPRAKPSETPGGPISISIPYFSPEMPKEFFAPYRKSELRDPDDP